jgi:hypothetical protein
MWQTEATKEAYASLNPLENRDKKGKHSTFKAIRTLTKSTITSPYSITFGPFLNPIIETLPDEYPKTRVWFQIATHLACR